MKKLLVGLLLIAVAALIVGCGNDTTAPKPQAEVSVITVAPTKTPTPTKATPKPTKKATPKPTKTPKPKPTKKAAPKPKWSELMFHSAQNDSRWSSERKSVFFTPKTGAMKIQWSLDPSDSEWNAGIVIFRKGQTPNNSNGAVPSLLRLAWIEPGIDEASGGTKTFTLKPGKQYYVWTALWHVAADVTISEER